MLHDPTCTPSKHRMGRASKWFRGLLGFKRSDPNGDPAHKPSSRKKRWSFSKRKDRHKSSHHAVAQGGYADDEDASRHAIAVATATAAAAEAAVAAAQAAAAVVHLTSGGGFDRPTSYGADYWILEERAAVVIQTHFRAYLAKRALRALRALVKLQALVRGHILRKHNVEKLQQMQALVRVQARVRGGTSSESPHSIAKPSCFNHAARASQEKVHRVMKHEQPMMPKRRASSNSSIAYDPDKSPRERRKGEASCEQGGSFTRIVHVDDDKSDKILEVDTGKPNMTPKRRNIFHSSHQSQSSDQYCQSFYPSKEAAASQTCLSPDSGEVQSPSPFYTAANSPLYYSVSSMDGISSKRAPSTPAKSDGSRSYQSNYSEHPSYMAYTESSKAKARSLSAPKQRPQWERSSSVNRYSMQGYGDTTRQKCSTLHANFSSKAYPGSGRLDRLGLPVRDAAAGFSSGIWHRY